MARFSDGQRVKYTSQKNPDLPNWFHAASMGSTGMVMHLNATDEHGRIKPITGTVYLAKSQPQDETWYGFIPDGWILPESGYPSGFQVPERQLRELDDPNEYLPGTVTDRMGNKVK